MNAHHNPHRSTKGLVFLAGLIVGIAGLAASQLAAVDSTVPAPFKPGEVISADVLNDLLARVTGVTDGFSTADELDGEWQCTEYSFDAINGSGLACGVPEGYQKAPGDLYATRTQTIRFESASNTVSFGSGFPAHCGIYPGGALNLGSTPFSATFDMVNRSMVLNYGNNTRIWFATIQKKSPNTFVYLETANTGNTMSCTRKNLPPNVPSGLAATVSAGMVTLTWTNNAADQIDFVIARKDSLAGSFVDVATAPSPTFSQSVPSGTYWYRVRARNGNGDSLGSNEVSVTI